MQSIQKPITSWAKALLFDFDFTLGDSSEAVVECVNFALQQVGAPQARAEAIKRTIGLPLNKIFAQFCPQHIEAASHHFFDCADRIMVDKTVLYPGVVEMLQALREQAGLQLAVISTKNHQRLEEIFDRFGLSQTFAAIVGGDDIPNPKPAPDATLLALKRLGCTAMQALFIGDSVMDAGSAKSAGVAFCGVTSGTTSAAQLHEAGALETYATVTGAVSDLVLSYSTAPQHAYRLPSLEELQNEVETTFYKSSGPGGQKKNKTASAVRMKHVPTGIIAIATESRSQHKNRELAWHRLIAKLEKLTEKPKPRKKTRPPASVKEARLKDKKATGAKKKLRKPPTFED